MSGRYSHFMLPQVLYSQNLTFCWPRKFHLCCPTLWVCLFLCVVLLVSGRILIGSKEEEREKRPVLAWGFASLHSPCYLSPFLPTFHWVIPPSLWKVGNAGCRWKCSQPQWFLFYFIFLLTPCLLANLYSWQWVAHVGNVNSSDKPVHKLNIILTFKHAHYLILNALISDSLYCFIFLRDSCHPLQPFCIWFWSIFLYVLFKIYSSEVFSRVKHTNFYGDYLCVCVCVCVCTAKFVNNHFNSITCIFGASCSPFA
jgi:hypothetical protein